MAGFVAKEFEVEGVMYRTGPIDAMQQLHIVRKLSPIIGRLAGLAPKDGEKAEDMAIETVLPALADAISGLSDETTAYVVFALLRPCSRDQGHGQGWGPVVTPGANALQYSDISMSGMLHIAWEALQGNLKGFFNALPLGLKDVSPRQSDPFHG